MSNHHAKALGKLGKGQPKTITDAERSARAERLAAVRHKRWEPKRQCPWCGKTLHPADWECSCGWDFRKPKQKGTNQK